MPSPRQRRHRLGEIPAAYYQATVPPNTPRPMYPSMIVNAPMDALRSHLYPVQPEIAGEALQFMAQEGGPPHRVFEPGTFGQQQWKKLRRWTWRDWDATAQSFNQVYDSPTTCFTARLNHHPGRTGHQISQELVETLWSQITDHDELPDERVPLARDISYPTPLPVSAFDDLDELERFASDRYWAQKLARREAIVRRMAEIDAEYAPFTRKSSWEGDR